MMRPSWKELIVIRALSGPLASLVGGYGEWLAERGYAELTIREHLWVMKALDGWLEAEEIAPDRLTDGEVTRFLAHRRAGGARKYVSVRGLGPLLSFLRESAGVPEPPVRVPVTAAEVLTDRYRSFLVHERGLAPRSVSQCVEVAERFLDTVVVPDQLDGLDARAVSAFITTASEGLAPKTVQHLLWSLRSLLGFLFLEGVTGDSLADAVPSVRAYSARGLPDPVTAADARRLVDSCDTSTPIGLRDRAVLLLMSGLGLRAGEIAGLGLGDLDWRAGEMIVHGKGGRVDRLPIPVDVGEALATYLRDGRPLTMSRRVFVSSVAPFGPLAKAGTMNAIVARAVDRAGIGPVTPHRLRHGTATQMLAAGASLAEIGQILRHRSHATTAIYAKVDHQRLAVLARPWPGATR